MHIVSVVGARPQFVKLAVIAHACEEHAAGSAIHHTIIHTGQHYDAELTDIFFEEMGIPKPDHRLEVGSGSHGAQTGEMLKRLEPVLAASRPDWVLLYGDTNSTLAGAIAASKLNLPLAHIESGLRSFNRRMPEEINRVVADHLSSILFSPTRTAMENLQREGLGPRAMLTGDVMYDAAVRFRRIAENRAGATVLASPAGGFALATVHRAENTDDPHRLARIMKSLERVAREICPVVLPLHPRTHKILEANGWLPRAVTVIRPAAYLDMLLLESRARFILTDSGGVQKEAYFFQVPCITLREETEWLETLENGCNTLTGANEERIVDAAARVGEAGPWTFQYGNGRAGVAMLDALTARSGLS